MQCSELLEIKTVIETGTMREYFAHKIFNATKLRSWWIQGKTRDDPLTRSGKYFVIIFITGITVYYVFMSVNNDRGSLTITIQILREAKAGYFVLQVDK